MKKLTAFLAAMTLTIVGFAQQTMNLVIFSDDGQPFYLVINGVRQNVSPETNVRITDLKAEMQRVKAIFSNAGVGDVDGNVMCEFGYECTYRIRKNNKGVYKIQPFGEPVALSNSTGAGSATVAYHTEPWPEPKTTGGTGTVSTTGTSTSGTGTSVGTTSTTTTTTTTTSAGGETIGTNININDGTTGTSENVKVNVSVGGVGLNMDVKINESGTGTSTTTSTGGTTITTKETVTTTTTTGGGWDGGSTSATTPATTGTSTSTGCYYPISDADFQAAKKNIEKQSFEETRVSTAKQIIKAKGCFSAEQIKQLCEGFSFEASRLDIAKYAYDYCSDKDNYYVVSDAFSFSSSTTELNKYIEKR